MSYNLVVAVKGIIQYNHRVLIIKRDDNDEIAAGTWEFAGGKIEFGEGLEDALIREVKEEADIDITIEKLLYAATFKTNPTRQVVILSYKCRAINGLVKLSEEHTDYKWATKEEMSELLVSDILEDMDKYNVFSEIF